MFDVRASRSGGETQHIVAIAEGIALCGPDATEWSKLEISVEDNLESAYCCERCKLAFEDFTADVEEDE